MDTLQTFEVLRDRLSSCALDVIRHLREGQCGRGFLSRMQEAPCSRCRWSFGGDYDGSSPPKPSRRSAQTARNSKWHAQRSEQAENERKKSISVSRVRP